ncbi:alpha/beta hydrolase fold domain-containing protein, partial [Streptomyces sp. S-9]|uniref:alpha/beta hydrolase fold domain-containing protein n=1 Tax=Streptomyces sp. S-9 TaxID=2806600 RepID=UPI001EEFDA83
HGGGWILGNAGTHDRLVRELAVGAEAAVVFVEYDRSPCALPHDDDRGLRLGTAAVTTQGMGAREMTLVAGLLASVLRGGTDAARAREDVRDLVAAFPPYPR